MSAQDSLHILFSKRRKALLALAYQRCGSYTDAEDFVQECFARAVTVNWAEVEKPDALLATILINLIRDHGRRKRRQIPETLRDFSDMLDQVSEKRAKIFRMRRFQGMSHAAIASATGLTKKGIEKHMQRALSDLREILRKYDAGKKKLLPDKDH
mgnify:CR=1 FL=1